MPKIGSSIPYSDLPCERCNGKRKVSKTWTEKIKTANGTTVIQHTQTICTNLNCQSKFEKLLLEEVKKREKLKQIKEDNATRRESVKVSRSKVAQA